MLETVIDQILQCISLLIYMGVISVNLEPYATPQTVEAIYQHYKDKRKNEHRPHLGGSQIGNAKCKVSESCGINLDTLGRPTLTGEK